jgi:DDE superfamily endonuclease
MNKPKCDELDYIHFLIAAQKVFSNTEAARSHPQAEENGPAHDTYTRLLYRIQSDGEALWGEMRNCVVLDQGILIIDDSTLDKPYARGMELATRHGSGKHHGIVMGINLISLLWTDGAAHWPCDFRIYAKQQAQLTKNDHFQAMLESAAQRGFRPELVAFDSWYSGLENLKQVRRLNWHWLTQLKSNRLVDPDGAGNRPVRELLLSRQGSIVHLKGYGFIKVFKIAVPIHPFRIMLCSYR